MIIYSNEIKADESLDIKTDVGVSKLCITIADNRITPTFKKLSDGGLADIVDNSVSGIDNEV